MDEEAKYILTFTTTSGVRDKYTIPRANKNLSSNEIFLLMGSMIDNGFIATAKGLPRYAESAELVEYSQTELI